jgi:hypothetical protein
LRARLARRFMSADFDDHADDYPVCIARGSGRR